MKQQVIDQLKKFRKDLHAHPEVSGKEFATQERIITFLKKNSEASISEIAETGVLAAFHSNKPGPVIMIRGDKDALRIQETNSFKHRSIKKGISHKCGHDGHTTILLGLAMQLSENPISNGKVVLLFQPAEENGMGAQSVLRDEKFLQNKFDFVFALHNLPGFEKRQIVVKESEFTANVKSIIVKINGKTAHAAEPEFGHNPAMLIAEILNYADKETNNDPDSSDFFLVTPIYATLGDKAYGISAGYGEVHLTIRSWSTPLMNDKCNALEAFIHAKSKQQHLESEISWTQVFHANINHSKAVEIIEDAAKSNHLKITKAKAPFKWGEDFGLFTQQFKGAMFGIGASIGTPALHNPDYDFPDEITSTGVALFHSIINETLNN